MEVTNQSVDKKRRLQQGQGLVEYSLILSLIAVVCVVILVVLGRATKTTFQKANCSIPGSTDPQCSCVNEKISVVSSSCTNGNLAITLSSSCSGSTITVNSVPKSSPASYTVNGSPVCSNPTATLNVQTLQPSPYNTSNSYQVRP
jgi:Flp pilus assembly pilin Flp